jgi:alkylation response protein AidB-like acyl-CoA dehydrogenase
MELVLGEQFQALAESLRGFISTYTPIRHVRACHDAGQRFDQAVWRRMCDELGLAGTLLDEEQGGIGAGLVGTSVVQEELGRGLVPSPMLSFVLASATLGSVDDETARSLLPRLASGEELAAIAFAEDATSWIPDYPATTATFERGQWLLHGRKSLVLDAAAASHLIVLANTAGGPELFLVDAAVDGIQLSPLSCFDTGRSASSLELHAVRGRRIEVDDLSATLRHVDAVAHLALAAEQLGAFQRVLEITTAYASERIQFGRPIGSFQAVKHPLADMAMEVELARSAVRYAAWCGDSSPADFATAALAAGVVLCEFHFRATATMIQLHGGVGYTWEHDAHLFYKHAKTAQLLLGTPSRQRIELARCLGLDGTNG